MARCSPAPDALVPPLEPGEDHLVRALADALDDRFEVYVQPHLNGDRPDLVVVRPDAGVLVVEVKDWSLPSYSPRDRYTWRLVKDGTPVRSPLAQVRAYKDNLIDLHVGALFEKQVARPDARALVATAVYFHRATTAEARAHCPDAGDTAVFGRDGSGPGPLRALVDGAGLGAPRAAFDDETYRELRRHLAPPHHEAERGRPVVYNAKQAILVRSRPGAQKVRGVAGSGKSVVLAGRAVAAHERTGSRVFVLSFNLTLRNYLHDRLSAVRREFPWSAFHVTGYHQFVKAAANNLGLDLPGGVVRAADRADLFDGLPTPRYAAVLVDEVQDFKTEWLRLLRRSFLAPDGELVVFGDEKQNVYGRALDGDRLPNTTVPGRWNELDASYRLNPRVVALARAFQASVYGDRYRPDPDVPVEQGDLFEGPPHVGYAHLPGLDADGLAALLGAQARALGLHPGDLAVLAPTVDPLRDLDDRLRAQGLRTARTFETNAERVALAALHGPRSRDFRWAVEAVRRGRKLHFWPQSGTAHLSTVHSYKGWEGHTVALVLGHGRAPSDELVYTALTRARHNLLVVDVGDDRYGPFFRAHADALPAAPAGPARPPLRRAAPAGRPGARSVVVV